MQELVQIDGACHCGNIRFALQWPIAQAEIPVRRCGCTFCEKHGGAWTSNRESKVSVTIDNPSLVSKYNFGTKTADFLVCAVCGAVPIVLSEIDKILYAVVNVNTFGETPDFTFSSSSTNFDGEDTGSRLERRKRNWIPNVQME